MSWVRLDDDFADHPKVLEAGNAAVGLFCRCLAYCAKHMTDGLIPAEVANLFGSPRSIEALVTAGLWVQVDGGYEVHDFLVYNKSRAQVKEERAKNAERQRRWHQSRDRNAVSNGVTNEAPSRPVPTNTKEPPHKPPQKMGGQVTT